MNWAYQPTAALEVDIGEPLGSMPSGAEAMKYMVATQVPTSSYTIIGDTTDTALAHAEISESGTLDILPSYIYYAQRLPDHAQVPGAPLEAVVARLYSKGMVLFRTDIFGGSGSWITEGSKTTIDLNNTYRRIIFSMNPISGRSDVTIGEAITSVDLGP